MSTRDHSRGARLVALAVALAISRGAIAVADTDDPATLKRQLEETQRTLRKLEAELETQQRETRKQIDSLQRQLRAQEKILDGLKAESAQVPAVSSGRARAEPRPEAPPAKAAAAPSAGPPPTTAQATTAEPWSPTAPIRLLSVGGAYMNVSFDVLVDAGWSTQREVTAIERGDHDPLQRGFTVPNTEVVFDGAVDPYFKGLADIVFKLDEDGETSVELEEAYLTTTSLPWNLQAKVGQQLVEFGRFNPQHPHQWDFVDQTLIINRMFGSEGLRSVGAKLSWLAPTSFYSELMVSVLNSSGGTAFSFRNSEDALFGRPPVERPVGNPSDLLYVPRYVASFDLTDEQTIVAGVSAAFGPNASSNHTDTQIYGADVYWKWKPAWQSGGFPFVAFQSEVMGRRYEAAAGEVDLDEDGVADVSLPRENLYDWGFHSQITYGFIRRWVAGLRGDWVSGDRGAFKDDEDRSDRLRISPDLTFYPTEFSKIRLQYNFDHGQILGDDSSVWLQLEFLLGSHGAHKF